MAKHRFDQKERTAIFAALTEAEQLEYNAMALGYDLSGAQANLDRMRELENLGFARLKGDA